jgi:hypothetical protein
MEIEFQQSYIDPTQSITTYGPRKIKVEKDFKYLIHNNQKIDLKYIQNIKFGNPDFINNVAARDVETHTMFRADDFDDFIVVRRYYNGSYQFERIDYMNIEWRKNIKV